MANEVYLFTALQAVLIILWAIALSWIKSVRTDLSEIRTDISKAASDLVGVVVRLTGLEEDRRIADSRLERVSGRTSDLSIDMEHLKTKIELCPTCNHMRVRHEEKNG